MLVPYFNRQEVYGGKNNNVKKYSVYYDNPYSKNGVTSGFGSWARANENSSPVNFWMPDLTKYPFFEDAEKEAVHLAPGDCIYIPAYYYYHLQGFRQLKPNDAHKFSNLP